ncbi:hypothetical protein EGH21_14395 [Halomicroarcula sp. F13]|uniref:Zinc ribbon domain-containing protein n=1 Tax=Haloarcula rubra TaxID=2487747 RepID=A0AAW4PUP8_9EURY|nr:hypothetical protein [Halomicroarcula rubra]MBX0324225.1 hypothetical protein [Halomicroarcula rubra]
MVSDPRCPHCDGKVSATATWCMHCGQDFAEPVEADGGRVVGHGLDEPTGLRSALESGDARAIGRTFESHEDGPRVVGVVLAVVAFVTLPMVSPSGVTFLYLAAVAGVGLYATRQPSAADAIRDGGTALAVAPLVLWVAAALLSGFTVVAVTDLFGPILYAGLVLFAVRRLSR